MAKFWIDFSATIIAEAETKEEAMKKFFEEKLFVAKVYEHVGIDSVEEISEPPEKTS